MIPLRPEEDKFVDDNPARFNQMAGVHVRKVIEELPLLARDVLRAMPGTAILAGGFIRDVLRLWGDGLGMLDHHNVELRDRMVASSLMPKDVDIFVSGSDKITDEVLTLVGVPNTRPTLSGSPSAFLGHHGVHNVNTDLCDSPPIQLIWGWTFNSPADLIDSFDFQWCKHAIWWTDRGWDGASGSSALSDVWHNTLRFTAPVRQEAPFSSLRRAFHFATRFGCKIEEGMMSDLISRSITKHWEFSWRSEPVTPPMPVPFQHRNIAKAVASSYVGQPAGRFGNAIDPVEMGTEEAVIRDRELSRTVPLTGTE